MLSLKQYYPLCRSVEIIAMPHTKQHNEQSMQLTLVTALMSAPDVIKYSTTKVWPFCAA